MTHVQDSFEESTAEKIEKDPQNVRKDSGIESDSCANRKDSGINTIADHHESDTDPEDNLPPSQEKNHLTKTDSYESVTGSIGEESSNPETSDESADTTERRSHKNSERSESVASDSSEQGHDVSDSSEKGHDSGIEAERELDMVIPDKETIDKIVAQVEFYFSDANVVKDKFLLKHIRRNKEGYVSLKLVSSFKKVKQITKDWRVVSYALAKGSNEIQINDEGTKIRRVQPLPEIDDSPVTCAVLALDLPLEKPSIENVSKMFASDSEIAFIRVLRAGGNLPPDVKSYLTKYPQLGQKHCAWIEFETPEAAKSATLLPQTGEMKVVLIVPESQKKQEKQKQQQKQQVQTQFRRNSFTNNKSFTNFNRYNAQNKPRKNSFVKFGNNENTRRPAMQRRKAVSLPSSQLPNISELSVYQHRNGARPKSKSCVEFSPSGAPCTSWVQRHLLAAAAASAASASSPTTTLRSSSKPGRVNRLSNGSLPLPDGVVRFPKGPDGSKGFGRPKQATDMVHESHEYDLLRAH